MHVVELRKFAIPEESMASAAVNTLDVHTKSHDNLVITVGASIVFDAHFNGLVRDLNHLEVVLHLFLQELMVQDHDSVRLHSTEDVVAASPGQVGDGLLGGLDRRQSLPALVGGGALGAHDLALPHDDETILGTTTQYALLLVIGDRVNLVVEELALEGGLVHGQMVVLISINVEQTDDTFT